MSARHTPGPWECAAFADGSAAIVVHDTDIRIAGCPAGWGRTPSENLANALLIARAPADATALDHIAYLLRDPDWGVALLEDVAAIVADTGRSLDNPTGEPTWHRH